ncbi:hypothetical protein IFE09_30975 [Streptomyces microflavus]|uniref:acyl-CoA dehydrogenase family protein n=1 Tax=Streptomyces TaxID=1883 RepID=UPI000B91BCD4|nr:acyl-CoA dehydrogenase family protein [Streptomyces microflavus]QQZ58434.1 hypothetical protein IFE09_30975 [Streptomyces microflavus]
MAVTATERAVRILGGEGHSWEQPVERMCRDARVGQRSTTTRIRHAQYSGAG